MAKISFLKTFKLDWTLLLITLVVIIGTWLRVFDLQNRGIFFPDAARDLLVARESITQRSLPLLGIPSSIPRLKQGPISIWIEMAAIAMVGNNLWLIASIFAMLNVLTIIVAYELLVTRINKSVAIAAAWLIATSPLAVAGARVPYHTNLLPLATVIFLYAAVRALELKKHGAFVLGLAWSFLLQFELAMAGTFLVVIYVLWTNRQKWRWHKWLKLVAGLMLGLFPQIFYDLQNGGKQLGGFAAWIAYRLGSFIGIWPEHTASISKFTNYLNSLLVYLPRVFAIERDGAKLGLLITVVLTLVLVTKKIKWSKLSPVIQITWLTTVSLLVTYALHSAPSEAYFPPFVVLLPILFSNWLLIWPQQKVAWLIIFLIIGISNISYIYNHNFFVDNSQEFTYGNSTSNQQQLIKQAAKLTNNAFYLTEDDGSTNHWRWHMLELKISTSPMTGVSFNEKNNEIIIYDLVK